MNRRVALGVGVGALLGFMVGLGSAMVFEGKAPSANAQPEPAESRCPDPRDGKAAFERRARVAEALKSARPDEPPAIATPLPPGMPEKGGEAADDSTTADDPWAGYSTTGRRQGATANTPWSEIRPVTEREILSTKQFDDVIMQRDFNMKLRELGSYLECMHGNWSWPAAQYRWQGTIRFKLETHAEGGIHIAGADVVDENFHVPAFENCLLTSLRDATIPTDALTDWRYHVDVEFTKWLPAAKERAEADPEFRKSLSQATFGRERRQQDGDDAQ